MGTWWNIRLVTTTSAGSVEVPRDAAFPADVRAGGVSFCAGNRQRFLVRIDADEIHAWLGCLEHDGEAAGAASNINNCFAGTRCQKLDHGAARVQIEGPTSDRLIVISGVAL